MKDLSTSTVVFRKFKQGGDIIALFPYYNEIDFCVLSYQHLGQHGAANYSHCIDKSVIAKPEEYKDLMKELESIGYKLKIAKRARPLF